MVSIEVSSMHATVTADISNFLKSMETVKKESKKANEQLDKQNKKTSDNFDLVSKSAKGAAQGVLNFAESAIRNSATGQYAAEEVSNAFAAAFEELYDILSGQGFAGHAGTLPTGLFDDILNSTDGWGAKMRAKIGDFGNWMANFFSKTSWMGIMNGFVEAMKWSYDEVGNAFDALIRKLTGSTGTPSAAGETSQAAANVSGMSAATGTARPEPPDVAKETYKATAGGWPGGPSGGGNRFNASPRQFGGPITQTKPYLLHAGEYVMPSHEYAAMRQVINNNVSPMNIQMSVQAIINTPIDLYELTRRLKDMQVELYRQRAGKA